ncbi:class I adenylate-forming enzyme family protein [Actinomycetospora termitidis]|uniref:Class I adenylate-forming enzyme family protein n=1 Tax=Actinomycetospora termitidis TaxID=3053470 RepID=A0ABT7MDC4_9PSEU|nr:class I adenylate-forming enzyme family protein [Actinomycetospora sp. Odt1-22]MDL5158471.1 class I adenylate-forming enzyme family protein [Actinomycetospora sp. Odt1-22]
MSIDEAAPSRTDVIAELTGPGGAFELAETQVRGVPLRVHVTGPRTLREAHEGLEVPDDRLFTLYDGERVTFGEHRARVATIARRLAAHGLRPGDRVAVCLRNYPEWPAVCWAAWVSGLVVVPLNAWWQASELAHAVADATPGLVVADGERSAVLREVTPDDVPVITVRGDASPSFAEFVGEVEAHPLPEHRPDPDDDAFILYTSGTTGRPKGAVGTHRNLVTDIANRRLLAVLGQRLSGVVPPERPGTLLAFPMFHVAGLCAMVNATVAGSVLATLYRWDAREALRVIADEGLTTVAGVPTIASDLLRVAEVDGARPALASLVGIGMGGAPIPPELVRRAAPVAAPSNGYGLTETTSGIAFNNGEAYVAAPDAVGRAVPSADVRVVDPASGTDLPDGEVGELWFRGPNVVRSYWNAPEATAAAFVDGWFRTGDLGRVDDGVIRVVDRLKDVVIRGGENVYCAAVEAELLEVDGVLDAAVVGIPHPSYGEEVAAVVVHAPGHVPDEEALRARVASRIAAFAAPTTVRTTTEPLPRNAVGKVLKRDLRETITRA